MGQIFYSFAMLAVIAVCYLSLSMANVRLIEPLKLMLLGWAFGFVLLASGAIMYQQQFSLLSFVVLSMSIGAATAGGILGSLFATSKANTLPPIDLPAVPLVNIVLMLGVMVYLVLEAHDLATAPDSILRSGFSALGELRHEHWAQTSADPDAGALGVIKSFARTSALLALMMAVFQGKRISFFQRWLTYAGVLLVVLEGLSAGGRSHIAFALLYFELSRALMLARVRVLPTSQIEIYLTRSPVRWYHIILGIVTAYVIFIYFPMSRNVALADKIVNYLNMRQPAAFGAWVDAASDNPFLVWVKPLAFGSGYFSQAIVIAIFYIQNTDISHFHMFGFYDGKFFVKLLSIFSQSVDKYWNYIDQRIAFEPYLVGYQTNPWGTVISDLLVDFGLWGTPVFMFFFGYLSQMGFRQFLIGARPEYKTVAVVIATCAAVSGAFGPFTNNMVAYPLFLMLILLGVTKVLTWNASQEGTEPEPSALPQT
jgi:hypothetical protein